MAYEFKKLSDVNVIEEMTEGLNVLVEDGGEIVKISANSMIPEDVALKSDIPTKVSEFENDASYISAPATAEVGQVIAVKAVDENGKPTEWEAVNVDDGEITIYYTNGSVLYHDSEYATGVTTAEMNNINPFKTVVNDGDGISQIVYVGSGYIYCIYTGSVHSIMASDNQPS